MSRYERRVWFDRLCELRDAYRSRGPDDATVALSVPDAIEWAVGRLEEPAEAPAATGPWDGPAPRPA